MSAMQPTSSDSSADGSDDRDPAVVFQPPIAVPEVKSPPQQARLTAESLINSDGGLEADVQIGDFRIVHRLGAGGMGIVYLARQISLDRLVALKVLGPALTRPNDRARYQREAQAAARLVHPGIARVYFVGQDKQVCYLAMEYVEGVSLRKVIEQLRDTVDEKATLKGITNVESNDDVPATVRFDEPNSAIAPVADSFAPAQRSIQAQRVIRSREYVRQCSEIVRDACSALAYAHQQGVIHRDLKPDNLMLDRQGSVHLIDFGVARFFDDQSLTCTGQIVGTPMYMSPEQVTGRITVDHRSDVYSMGVVLAELLTLEPPVPAPTREAVLRHIVTKSLPPVSWRNPGVPAPLTSIVHKATAKDADERYQSAGELAEDLGRFLEGKPVAAPTYRYKLDASEIVINRPKALVAAAFIYLVLGAICVLPLGTFLVWGGSSSLPLSMQFYFYHGVAAVVTGIVLLQGRRIGWWAGVVLGLYWTCRATTSITALFFIGSLIDSGSTDFLAQRPWLAAWIGVDDWVTAVGMVPAGEFARMLVPFFVQCLLAVFIVATLMRRNVRQWFQLADTVRRAHRRTRKAK